MQFVHIADMHFDMPFSTLNSKTKLGEIRRIEQRGAFNKIIEFIKENDIKYFFISGDLYEQEHVRQSTIEYINNCFKKIPNTKIYISPGNHDPIIKNSYYNKFNWAENVNIFTNEIGKYEEIEENVNIYGYGFDDFTVEKSPVLDIKLDNKEAINILVCHASLDASTLLEKSYNPIPSKILKNIGFDYVALGHIHKKEYEAKNICYSGSAISLGFDEPGDHGMLVGEIIKGKDLELAFVPVDKRKFEEKVIDVTNITSFEELIQILDESYMEKIMYKIILTGKRSFEINISKIFKTIINENILKIDDRTRLDYELELISKQNNLKGIFVRNMLEKIRVNPEKEMEIKKSIEIGLNAL